MKDDEPNGDRERWSNVQAILGEAIPLEQYTQILVDLCT